MIEYKKLRFSPFCEVIVGNNKAYQSSKKISPKKKLMIAVILTLSVIILLWGIVALIEYISLNNIEEEYNYNFYPANYDEDIFEDERYLELIQGEYVRFCDASTNLTVGVNMEALEEYPEEVRFMLEGLLDAINGDYESYNSRFSQEYYKNNKPYERFTMQKIYDVTLTLQSSESVTDEETGRNYTKYSFALQYKIYQNNGTFRNDSQNGTKKQYFTVTNRTGELLIDSVGVERVKK